MCVNINIKVHYIFTGIIIIKQCIQLTLMCITLKYWIFEQVQLHPAFQHWLKRSINIICLNWCRPNNKLKQWKQLSNTWLIFIWPSNFRSFLSKTLISKHFLPGTFSLKCLFFLFRLPLTFHIYMCTLSCPFSFI